MQHAARHAALKCYLNGRNVIKDNVNTAVIYCYYFKYFDTEIVVLNMSRLKNPHIFWLILLQYFQLFPCCCFFNVQSRSCGEDCRTKRPRHNADYVLRKDKGHPPLVNCILTLLLLSIHGPFCFASAAVTTMQLFYITLCNVVVIHGHCDCVRSQLRSSLPLCLGPTYVSILRIREI